MDFLAIRPNVRGFTLIEMAIVLVVVGLLISGGLFAIVPVIQGSKVSESKGRLDRIEQSLTLYVIQNGCLPCPANGSLLTTSSNAGWSHSTSAYYGPGGPSSQPCAGGSGCNTDGGAATAMGVVPWKSLGLSQGDVLDAWSNYISYAVTDTLANSSGISMVRTPPSSYPSGNIAVNNNTPVSQSSAAAYVLISHGRDGSFAFNTQGGRNSDRYGSAASDPQGRNAPANFSSTNGVRQDEEQAIESTSYFDDIVRWRTAPNIIQNCGSNACGNPV